MAIGWSLSRPRELETAQDFFICLVGPPTMVQRGGRVRRSALGPLTCQAGGSKHAGRLEGRVPLGDG